MKRKLIAFIVALSCLLQMLSCEDVILGDEMSTDIKDYSRIDTDFYSVFPKEIPENATVTEFLFFECVIDLAHDYFLELSFPDLMSMETFLEEQKQNVKGRFPQVEMMNPISENYIEWHDTSYADPYYKVEMNTEGKLKISMSYDLIAFSKQDLKVVIFSTNQFKIDYHIPKYFTYFGVPIEAGVEYYVCAE